MSHATDTLEKIKVMQAYADGAIIQIEVATSEIGKTIWKDVDAPTWSWRDNNYRIKPAEPVVPDTIDWSAVHPRFNFMARDEDDQVWLFIGEPKLWEGEGFWTSTSGDACRGDTFASYKNGGMPWDKSMVERT